MRCKNVLSCENVLRCENILRCGNVLRCKNVLRCENVWDIGIKCGHPNYYVIIYLGRYFEQ